jgi:adenylate kinase
MDHVIAGTPQGFLPGNPKLVFAGLVPEDDLLFHIDGEHAIR